MPRLLAVLRAAGVEAVPAATDFEVDQDPARLLRWLLSAEALQRSIYALHEWIGLAVYRWRGWL